MPQTAILDFMAIRRGLLTSFINLSPIANIMKINPSEFHIKFIKHPEIANARLAFRTALQTFVWECFQPCSHLINLALHGFADSEGQSIKRLGKSGRPNLKGSSHGLFWLTDCVVAFGNFTAGLVKFGLHFIGEFELVFQKIVNPCPNLLDFRARKLGQNCFNFLNRTHASQDNAAAINSNPISIAHSAHTGLCLNNEKAPSHGRRFNNLKTRPYLAPWSIHARIRPIWSAVRGAIPALFFNGGM